MDFPVVVVIIGTLVCHDTFETLQQLITLSCSLPEKYQYFGTYINCCIKCYVLIWAIHQLWHELQEQMLNSMPNNFLAAGLNTIIALW